MTDTYPTDPEDQAVSFFIDKLRKTGALPVCANRIDEKGYDALSADFKAKEAASKKV